MSDRGRPREGRTVEVRLPDEILDPLDQWAVEHEIKRAEAIRQLLNVALVTLL